MIRIKWEILAEIEKNARQEAPLEACGYLACAILTADGLNKEGVYCGIVPMKNADKSPEHFSFEPAEQFEAVKKARGQGWRLSAVYHSHPATPARLSAEDLRLANDPDMVYLVYSLLEEKLRAFRVDRQKKVLEITIEGVD
jgi:proteasome lid subunit RPN8/RPN11